MPSSQPELDKQRKSALVESVWRQVKDLLEKERHRIYEDIKNYPRPIPGCDVQFNYLLERRADMSVELERLHEAASSTLDPTKRLQALWDFIDSSSCLQDEARATLLACLKEGCSEQ
jgi:hypothetical protein